MTIREIEKLPTPCHVQKQGIRIEEIKKVNKRGIVKAVCIRV